VLSLSAKGAVNSLATLKPRGELIPTEAEIAEIARRIDEAGSVVIMCGAGCQGAAEELRALSDRLKAPLVHSIKGKDIMPYDDPHWVGGIGLIGTKPAYRAAQDCDLFVMIGTDYPYSNYLPAHGRTVQIDERPAVLGRRAPTAYGVAGSARPTLKLLLERVKPKIDSGFMDKVTHQRKSWDEKLDRQSDLGRSRDRIHPQAVARAVSSFARDDAVFVLDTGLNTLWSANWIQQRGSQRIIGSFNNAAVGTALGQANGIQVLDRSRQVIALCGDGGFNMLMGEFLTSVHHKLPVKVIIYNNSSLGLIRDEAEMAGLVPFEEAIRFPNPDFAGLAQACGGHGFRAERPEELKAAIEHALAVDGPAIVDAVVVANELPNIPHLELEMIENVAIAKIKEAVQAVIGG
jgi:thiamine pyrophosphate-dependent acetolactate synthase large subunit-like protein